MFSKEPAHHLDDLGVKFVFDLRREGGGRPLQSGGGGGFLKSIFMHGCRVFHGVTPPPRVSATDRWCTKDMHPCLAKFSLLGRRLKGGSIEATEQCRMTSNICTSNRASHVNTWEQTHTPSTHRWRCDRSILPPTGKNASQSDSGCTERETLCTIFFFIYLVFFLLLSYSF